MGAQTCELAARMFETLTGLSDFWIGNTEHNVLQPVEEHFNVERRRHVDALVVIRFAIGSPPGRLRYVVNKPLHLDLRDENLVQGCVLSPVEGIQALLKERGPMHGVGPLKEVGDADKTHAY